VIRAVGEDVIKSSLMMVKRKNALLTSERRIVYLPVYLLTFCHQFLMYNGTVQQLRKLLVILI
jgi:hypothetical protein